MRKRLRIIIPLAFLLAVLAAGGVAVVQPRCCLTWANARMWQHFGYFQGMTTRQVEDLIYTQCAAIGCQMQDGGGCPSQWGVEEVAASWGMPGYVNPPQWDWSAALQDVQQERSILFFWSGAGHTHPPSLMHAYWCSYYEEPREMGGTGRLWCTDALNPWGRWWDEGEILAHWPGWSAGWRP